MRLKLAVWIGLGLYTLLSVTDWAMTYALLRLHPDAVESNPLAAACLEQYGWNGLALYKTGGVLIVLGSVVLLLRRRPAVAAGVIAFGCAVLLWVTTYTHTLICEAHREAATRAAWLRPNPKFDTQRTASAIPVPDQCWFATTHPVHTTAALK